MTDYVAKPEPVDDDIEVWMTLRAYDSVEGNAYATIGYGTNAEEQARVTLTSTATSSPDQRVFGAVVKVKVPRSILRQVKP